MQLVPVLTEKSLNEAKNGRYSFWVGMNVSKFQVKEMVEALFKVKVAEVKVTKIGAELRRSSSRKLRLVKASKKAIVSLKEGKIDLFEEIANSAK